MRSPLLALASALLLPVACTDPDAADVLRFSVIPDWNKGELRQNGERLAAVLSDRLGVDVRYEPSNDYTACVNGLIADKLDFVWLGGKTTVDAIDAGEGHVHVLATRDIDLHFKSYFIGNADVVASGGLSAVDDLRSWRGITGDLRFTFGSKSSTSGHLMPRHFLIEAGLVPEQAFRSVGYASSHSGTLQAVANGTVDCGALNYAHYDGVDDELKAKAPILYTTPEYVDYAWVVHDRIGDEMRRALQAALLGLGEGGARGRAILAAWQAGRFLAARDEQWHAIRRVRDSLPKDFLKR